jgi:hypothetical protein
MSPLLVTQLQSTAGLKVENLSPLLTIVISAYEAFSSERLEAGYQPIVTSSLALVNSFLVEEDL